MELSKNNRFSAEEAINYIPRTEKRKNQVLWVFVLPILPFLPRKLKIIADRGSSTIPPSSKFELPYQYEMTS